MNPFDFTTRKDRRLPFRRLTLVRRQSLLLQRMTSSRQGKPEKEFTKVNSRMTKNRSFY